MKVNISLVVTSKKRRNSDVSKAYIFWYIHVLSMLIFIKQNLAAYL